MDTNPYIRTLKSRKFTTRVVQTKMTFTVISIGWWRKSFMNQQNTSTSVIALQGESFEDQYTYTY